MNISRLYGSPSKAFSIHLRNVRKYQLPVVRGDLIFLNGSKFDVKRNTTGFVQLFPKSRGRIRTQSRLISNSNIHKSIAIDVNSSISVPQHISLKPSISIPLSDEALTSLSVPTPQTQTCTAQSILRVLHYFGSSAFAFNGATIAGSAGMHVLGCIIVGTINAVGGGTIRDILIGNTPVFWMRQPQFLLIGLVASGVTFVLWPYLEEKKMNIPKDSFPMIMSDACGVASISIVGAQNALQMGLSPSMCIILGMVSSSFGGVVRDILCEKQPRILHNHAHLYGITALCGSATYVGLKCIGVNPKVRIATAFCASMLSRFLAWKFNFTLIHWEWASEKSKTSNKHLDFVTM